MPIENQNRPSEYEDEHGMSKPQPHPSEKFDAEHPGYETTDVNTRGVVVFLAGLMAFLVVFFLLCFAMGKAINYGLLKQDGDEAKLSPQAVTAGGSPAVDHKRVNLPTNPYMEQKESARLAQSFPTPRLDADDSNQSTSDLHAREDLLLDHTTAGTDGSIRIPIDQAMEAIVKRGLPAPAGAPAEAKTLMAGETNRTIHAPLTNGFARTGFEIDQIESREQKMKYANEASGETVSPTKK
ncbi:hypothetical protein [Terriglobus saanensis]|uniref:Transmembrane protein n=1 Tax=Terriglobus saanensis (strain ATCC BAA-1853 / DSM 23119 / SP1PR4) TaxID=401053 RepID=E8V4G7_TERSS|nr:hypothetical protein [Terriglobus saanensis]ADV84791.1 hypothetical protein AciPR4_4042 [Terriglobus saanensis SP1PR4]